MKVLKIDRLHHSSGEWYASGEITDGVLTYITIGHQRGWPPQFKKPSELADYIRFLQEVYEGLP